MGSFPETLIDPKGLPLYLPLQIYEKFVHQKNKLRFIKLTIKIKMPCLRQQQGCKDQDLIIHEFECLK